MTNNELDLLALLSCASALFSLCLASLYIYISLILCFDKCRQLSTIQIRLVTVVNMRGLNQEAKHLQQPVFAAFEFKHFDLSTEI